MCEWNDNMLDSVCVFVKGMRTGRWECEGDGNRPDDM
jgi:hypothetical protein